MSPALLLALHLIAPSSATDVEWRDDFSDDDISDWTQLDGAWTVSGGVVSGYSSTHTGPDFIIEKQGKLYVRTYNMDYVFRLD